MEKPQLRIVEDVQDTLIGYPYLDFPDCREFYENQSPPIGGIEYDTRISASEELVARGLLRAIPKERHLRLVPPTEEPDVML